jgi:5-methyltetrahydropteroyltriglutamate--homocysteine methyltransferase
MLKTTSNLILPTAITGSYPRPLWFDMSLSGRSFKFALGESLLREQYMDAVAAVINAQEAAGLDIVTDGDSRFDLAVGGKSWFFYPIERLGGISGHRDTARGTTSPRQNPVGSAGSLSAQHRLGETDSRPLGIHRTGRLPSG